MQIWVYLIISIVLSLIFVPRLTAGAVNTPDSKPELSRELQPVVSQTGATIPAIKQMLPVDPESVPGQKSVIWSGENLHYFDNTEIVDKLCGPGITAGGLLKWRNIEKNWQVEYGADRINTDMSKVQSIDETKKMRRVHFAEPRVSTDYYHNPTGYCTSNPEKYPCPNYWRECKEPGAPTSADMYLPGLAKGEFRKPLEVEDKVSINVVNRATVKC